MMENYEYGYMHSIFPGFGILLQLILFIIFLSIIYWLVKTSETKSSPEEILKKRLAKGEINKKEYKELKSEIDK